MLLKGNVAAFTNELCAILNTIVSIATDGEYDFECCQCYISSLPETGHSDDVQLGAQGFMDDYSSKAPTPPEKNYPPPPLEERRDDDAAQALRAA
jgi:hypothetical protein